MIETERLQLIACNKMHLATLLQGERNLADLLGVGLADNWLIFPEAVPHALQRLQEDSNNLRWGMHFFLHKAENKIIGNGGFKGAPDAAGMVEIGYAVSPEFENQGFATEAARGMIEYAFSWAQVKTVDAHTLAEENASCRVLRKCGMTKISEKHDPDDGDIWQWRVSREEYAKPE